jgi:hypothetical protein
LYWKLFLKLKRETLISAFICFVMLYPIIQMNI